MSDPLDLQAFANDAASALQEKIGDGGGVTAWTFDAANEFSFAKLYPPDTTMIGFEVKVADGRLWRCAMPISDHYNPVDFAYESFVKAQDA